MSYYESQSSIRLLYRVSEREIYNYEKETQHDYIDETVASLSP